MDNQDKNLSSASPTSQSPQQSPEQSPQTQSQQSPIPEQLREKLQQQAQATSDDLKSYRDKLNPQQYLTNSTDFVCKAWMLKESLEELKQDNTVELAELDNLITEIHNSILSNEHRNAAVVPCFNSFIKSNLMGNCIDEIDYTILLIKRAQQKLLGSKIETVCKIELLLNKIIFCLKIKSEDSKYELNFPNDNFEVLFEADRIDQMVQKKFNNSRHSRVVSKAVSGTLVGDSSDSILCDYSIQSRSLQDINPLEYYYLIYSNSKESQSILNNKECLNKLVHSLESSEIDEYQRILISASKGKLSSEEITQDMRELSASHGAEMWELLDILTYVIKYDFVINVKDEDTFCSYRESFNRVPRSTIVKNPRNSFDRVHRAFGTLTDLIMGLITAGLIQSPDYFKYINQAISGNELKNDDDILDFTDEVLCGMCSDMYQAISNIPDNNVQHALDNKILENIIIRFIQLLENPGADDNNYVIGMLYTLIASIYTSIYDHCIKAIQKGKSPVLASIKYDEEAYDMRIDADKKFMDLFESISYMEKMKIKFGEIISNGGNLKQEIKNMGKMNKK